MRVSRLLSVPVLVAGLLLPSLSSCPGSPPVATAKRVTSRADLIGGPRALGEVGDFLLQNGKVRFIIQDKGFSRGFGVFGGSLIDADLVRPESVRGNSEGGTGKDNFGEMFPAFFLEALEPFEVEDPNSPGTFLPPIVIENDGSDGESAVLVVRGVGGDFLALTQTINEVVLDDPRSDPNLFFETRYILAPGAGYLEIETRVQNIDRNGQAIELPKEFLPGVAVPTPFGDVILFGAGNKVFLPNEAGFDPRFRLEDLYADGGITLPALPGLVADYIASASTDVSYGVVMGAPEGAVQNFSFANRDQFPDANERSLHVPFIASAFTGVFQVLPPPSIAPNDGLPGGDDEMKFRRYFIVGGGDVASVANVAYGLLGKETGTVNGRVFERLSRRDVDQGSIVVVGTDGRKVTQANSYGGNFTFNAPPGDYDLYIVKDGYRTAGPERVTVTANQAQNVNLFLEDRAEIFVTVVERGRGRVPAKVSLVAQVPDDAVGQPGRKALFDQSLGEPFQYTDFVPDDASDPSTLRYLEDFRYSADGVVRLRVPAGRYTVVAGRGMEYSRFEQDVTVAAGSTLNLTAEIDRVVDTSGYIGADFHLHSQFSLDSNAALPDRIVSYAGEGLELAVSTDHNFVVDYQPTIQKLGMERFLNTLVGLELTTIDRGHFNGFPIDRGSGSLETASDTDGDGFLDSPGISSRTYGSFEWALRTPGEVFTSLRALGQKNADGVVQPIILQVNHPRDSILGYFDQYAVDADDLTVRGQSGLIAPNTGDHPEFLAENFDFGFDAIEVFNGKRMEFLHSFRVPDGVTFDRPSCCPITPGAIFRELPELDCDDTIPGDCDCDQARADARALAGDCNFVGEVAFPGVVEDWIHLLETGKRVVGTANSDSHEPDKEEPGAPRTYVRVPTDDPAQVSAAHIVEGLKSMNVLLTNGPFVRVTAGDVELGGLAAAVDGSVTLSVRVEAAPWVKPDTLRVYSGIEVVATVAIDSVPFEQDIEITLDDDDAVLLVEVTGAESMFPSLFPNEIPPLQFTDVIGALGDSLGLATPEGALEPALTFVTTPYAITNPLFVDVDLDGSFTPSRPLPDPQARTAGAALPRAPSQVVEVVTAPTQLEQAQADAKRRWLAMPLRKRLELQRFPRWLWPTDDPKDVRRVLMQFTRHRD